MYLNRYSENVDFGPTFQASQEEKNDAREMWELMFRKKEKTYSATEKPSAKPTKEEENNPLKRISKPTSLKQKSVQEILEFEKLGIREN